MSLIFVAIGLCLFDRSLMFVSNQFGGVVPEMNLRDTDVELLALVTREVKAYVNNLDSVKLVLHVPKSDHVCCLI